MAKQAAATVEAPPQPMVVEPNAPAAPPPPKLVEFEVSWAEEKRVILARDSIEAWAVFCDAIGKHPSPKAGLCNGKKVGA